MGEAVSSNFKDYVRNSATAPWALAAAPFRIAPRIYYVGNQWVGAFLIDTEDGLVLIDTTVFETVHLVLESIRELGFDPKNIRHILLSHFHFDHSAGVEAIRQLSGAQVWLDKADADVRNTDAANAMLCYDGFSFKNMPYPVDHYYEHSSPMKFGSVTIQTILTPGHTAGTTSFIISMPDENGNNIVAAMHGGVGPVTMANRVLNRFGWPASLRERFIQDCDKLKAIPVDIAIPSHPAHGNLFARCSGDPMDYHSFVDPTLWPAFLEERKEFVQKLDKKERQQ